MRRMLFRVLGMVVTANAWLMSGLQSFDEVTWDGPWVFGVSGLTQPLPALDNSRGQRTNGPVPIRLDDGSTGALRVESQPCTRPEECAPFDCGCALEHDSYWIIVTGADGRTVARLHLWAAYGKFQIVPVELVDGIGDELLIVRVPAQASPPIGYDLKIWKVAAKTPVDLGGLDRVAGLLGARPIGCARWRTNLLIDQSQAKPRVIGLRHVLGSSTGCSIDPDEVSPIADMRRDRALSFDANRGRYMQGAPQQGPCAPISPGAAVSEVGAFSNMRFTAEHAYGETVLLWRAGICVFGLFSSSQGLQGDTPIGELQDVIYSPESGALKFTAKLTMGVIAGPGSATAQPSRDLFTFDGRLDVSGLTGSLQHITQLGPSPARTVVLNASARDAALMRAPGTYRAWREKWEPVLIRRGPRW